MFLPQIGQTKGWKSHPHRRCHGLPVIKIDSLPILMREREGCHMDASVCWELFRETGQPVFYLLYRQAAEAEAAPRTA